jgi:hypothetical protein
MIDLLRKPQYFCLLLYLKLEDCRIIEQADYFYEIELILSSRFVAMCPLLPAINHITFHYTTKEKNNWPYIIIWEFIWFRFYFHYFPDFGFIKTNIQLIKELFLFCLHWLFKYLIQSSILLIQDIENENLLQTLYKFCLSLSSHMQK